MDSFVLIWTDYTVEEAIRLVNNLDPTHVILVKPGVEEECYLLSRLHYSNLMANVEGDISLLEVFDFNKMTPAAILGPYDNVNEAPRQCIVADGSYIMGFFDASIRISAYSTRFLVEGPKERDVFLNTIIAYFPEIVQLDDIIPMAVFINSESNLLESLRMSIEEESEVSVVEIIVQPKQGFEIKGDRMGNIVMSDAEESDHLQFTLHATQVGVGNIIIHAFHRGRLLGTLSIAPIVEHKARISQGERMYFEDSLTTTLHEEMYNMPDISLYILEHELEGNSALSIYLAERDSVKGRIYKEYEPVYLSAKPVDYFHELYRKAHSMSNDFDSGYLDNIGQRMFNELLPKDLRKLLWSLRHQNISMLINSDEPWIPWELCKLEGKDNQSGRGPFLGEAFSVTRWIPDVTLKYDMSIKDIALVTPEIPELQFASKEKEFMMGLREEDRKVKDIPSNRVDVLSAMAEGNFDTWHIIAHGGYLAEDPNRCVLLLDDDRRLIPEEINGIVKKLGKEKQPLVFLNANHSGHLSGWANHFLNANASAFVGAYWAVYDKPAYEFAVALYNELFSGIPLGEAARKARLAIKTDDNPSWLAYTVFGNPLVRTH